MCIPGRAFCFDAKMNALVGCMQRLKIGLWAASPLFAGRISVDLAGITGGHIRLNRDLVWPAAVFQSAGEWHTLPAPVVDEDFGRQGGRYRAAANAVFIQYFRYWPRTV
jgi:hypothetical protein